MKVLFKRASRLAAASMVLAFMVGCGKAGLPQFHLKWTKVLLITQIKVLIITQ
jgi:hypothetical protein